MDTKKSGTKPDFNLYIVLQINYPQHTTQRMMSPFRVA